MATTGNATVSAVTAKMKFRFIFRSSPWAEPRLRPPGAREITPAVGPCQASDPGMRIIDHKGRRLAYIHMWSWATIEFQKLLLDAIAKSNTEGVDGFVLDIRDGWGGASGNYLGVFWKDVPLLESVGRDGKRQSFDQQIRKPAVLLVNGGTRSGKETIAYGAKKHPLARLLGERTAGAYLGGGPSCLSDGSLLVVAMSESRV